MNNKVPHEYYINRCLELCEKSVREGNGPFGALLVIEGEIVLEATDKVSSERNPIGHAEINLISRANHLFTPVEMASSILYDSTEPCVMCTGAIFFSKIRQVVYGCSAESLAPFFPDDILVPCREIFETATNPVEVIGPIMESEALLHHERFWN